MTGRIILPPSLLSIKSRQAFDISLVNGNITANLAISSVDMNNTILLTDGVFGNINTGTDPEFNKKAVKLRITSATNIEMTRNTALPVHPNIGHWISGAVVEFNSGVLKKPVVRGVYTTAGNGGGGTTPIDTGAIFSQVSNKAIFSFLGLTTDDNNSSTSQTMGITARLNNNRDGIYFMFNGTFSAAKNYSLSYEVAEFL